MVIALFAALIVPWFVNWNDYRASFEAEASRILGHRVHVEGDAHPTILPSPSLTFTKVEVDDESGARIMDVGRFDVVIELMPLLQGQIRVISMMLEQPVVNVSVDAAGKVAWLSRAKLREPFDPDKVVLDNITIRDGSLTYADAKTGVALSFGGISAQISARALSGPWHVDGFYLDNGNQVGFRLSTGHVLDDGTIRLKADVNPARWPVTVGVDGPVGIDPANGLTWSGTYSVSQVAGADEGSGDTAATGPTGWRSEGAFTLTGDRLDISKAVLSNGPADRSLSVAGTLLVNFGKSPSFAASAEARQIDLDRTLGKGPSQPVDVSAAADSFLAWLNQLPIPDVPGSIKLDVPAIVVGGRIIEDVAFTAAPANGGWLIDSLAAKLPGQATLEASGQLTTHQKLGFVGQAHLAVGQPATFATWWRGDTQEGGGRLLAPFDLSGRTDIEPGRVSVDHVTAKIDNAAITGSFGWAQGAKGRRGDLFADVDASRIDFVQLKALAELLVGHDVTSAGSLADGYTLHIKADAFAFEDLTVKGIEVNAQYSDDALTVTMLQIEDIGGARIAKTSGKIDTLSGDPRGHLDATLDAPSLIGLARLADRFLPESGLTRWLDAAAPALGEAVMTARVAAPPPDGGSGFAFTVDNGVAGATAFNVSAKFTGGFAHWRTKPAEIKATLDSPDSSGLARQFGLAAVALDKDGGAHLEVQAKGVAGDGLDTVVVADLAGLVANASGKLTVGEDLAPSFAGKIGLNADNIDPIIAMAGLDIPGAAEGTALGLDGQLSLSNNGLDLSWKGGKLGAAIAGGAVTLAPDGARGWRIGGDLVTDEVDLGWIASLGLGFAPVPTGDPAEPWSRTPFASPAYGPLTGKLQVTADRLNVGDLGVTGTKFALALQPQRIDLDLTAGQLAGGTVTGGMSVHNVGGNANFNGRFDLKGAALESFVWRRDERSVATGTLDLSANFESTGRSPAGLVSTLTGGGVLSVRDGLARYVNPNTVRQIVRASDLGQQFSEDALRAAFGERIDADNLAFKDAGSAFAIVAGAVRLKNLMVKTDGLAATGNAVIDFNTMALDSDWNLAFDPVDDKVQGVDPEAGIVFHGPITAPGRTIDVLPLSAYLNEREAARMNEIIALDAATRAEKEHLNRLADKLKEDAAQRAEDARIAAEREAARRAEAAAEAATLEAFHSNREILVERLHVDALTALADRLAARQKEAEATAADAAQAAQAARADADAAGKALADAVAADAAAVAKAQAAAADLATAKAGADSAAQDAAQLAGAAAAAKQALARATTDEADAKAAAERAVRAKEDADAALKTATKQAAGAASAANKANAVADSAISAKADADKAAAAAIEARDTAKVALADAEAAVTTAQAAADDAVSKATTLGGGRIAAEADKAKADTEAKAAADAVASAIAVRDDAAGKLVAGRKAVTDAQQAVGIATANAESAAKLAESTTVVDPSTASADAIASAHAAQQLADHTAKVLDEKKGVLDSANAALADAQATFDRVATAVVEAEKRAATATAAAAAADTAVKAATASAGRANSVSAAALNSLDQATGKRDAAKAALAEREAAVSKTAGVAITAAKVASDAAEAATKAQAEAKAALADKADAEQIASDRAGPVGDTAKAAQAATSGRVSAAADARTAAAKALAAGNASASATKTLAARTSANDAAQAGALAAARDRATAQAAAASLEAQAKSAEAAAGAAAADATDAAAAAEAARQTAERAALNTANADTIAVPIPPVPGASPAPAGGDVAAVPVPTTPAPAPRQKAVPQPAPPIPIDRPLVITPPSY